MSPVEVKNSFGEADRNLFNTRSGFVSWMSLLAACSGVLTGYFELVDGEFFMGAWDVALSVILLASGALSFYFSSLHKISGHVLVVVGTLLLLIAFVTGGLDNSSTAWLGLVPVVGVFVYGWKKAGLVTFGFVVYMICIYFLFPELIASGPDYSDRSLRQLILSIVTFYIATAYFDWKLESSQTLLRQKMKDLAQTNQELAKEIKLAKKFKVELEQSLLKLEQKNQGEEDVRRAMLNLLEDIQAEKQKSSELSERFILATQSAKIGVWEYVPAQDKLEWDENMYEIYGVKKVVGGMTFAKWKEFFLPADRIRRDQAIEKALKGLGGYSEVLRISRSDGVLRYIRAHALVIKNSAGEVLKIVGVNWDVTREQEIDKAKSEFVSLASHQLRTPLSTIGWYAEMLLAGDAGQLNSEQGEYVGEIAKGNARMVELVNALLNVSRLELGTFIIEPEQASPVDLAKDVVKEQAPQLSAKSQTLTESYGKGVKVLPVDKKLLRMVMQNFLSNAVKYTPQGGKIEIGLQQLSAMPEQFAVFGDPDDILFFVKDSGLGVPDSQKDKIFHKMFRADNVKVTSTEGTGLGLYIAKTIMEQSGGKIWFESKENKGSTFFALIPKQGMKAKKGSKSLS